jgi:hypothetical protein
VPGGFGRVLYAAPKLTLLERGDLAVAIGAIGIAVFIEDENITRAGLRPRDVRGAGALRHGRRGARLRRGRGSSGAVITLGGELQLSNSIKLLTENYLIPIEESYSSGWTGSTGRGTSRS